MLYRIRLDLAFDDEDPVRDIIDKAQDNLADAVTINPGQDNEEKGFIIIEHCFHDENPPQPCQVIIHYQTP